eukprot:Hpha_TRINITY_DN12280_c1_g1::TRINITY_DN12280_c1_g1_i1::g.16846::m.16846
MRAAKAAAQVTRPAEVHELFSRHKHVCERVIEATWDRMRKCEVMSTVDEVFSCAESSAAALKELVREFDRIGEGAKDVSTGKRRNRSRYGDGLGEIDVDLGVTDFFSAAATASYMGMQVTVESALSTDSASYVVCLGCRSGIQRERKELHAKKCTKTDLDATPEGNYADMNAEWVIEQAKVLDPREEALCVAMYTLESPLCYEVNRRMRSLAFQRVGEGFEAVRNFAHRLHRDLISLPKYEGTVFRAVDFRVSDSLYRKDSLVTMPHQTSASEDPVIVKRFLGNGGQGRGKRGSILVMHTKTARSIARFSKYPSEREVLIPANAQFVVVGRPHAGMIQLLESALETDLGDVSVVEMREVEFEDWGQLRGVLSEVQQHLNKALLGDGLNAIRWVPPRWTLSPRTGESIFREYPSNTVLQGRLLELAIGVPDNHKVISVMLANLDTFHVENVEAVSKGLALAVSLRDPRSTAALLSRGASPSSLPPELRSAWVAQASVFCKAQVVRQVAGMLGETFWEKDSGSKGRTVLHTAAELNRDDLLKALLEHGSGKIQLDCVDGEGKTPCYLAAESGSEKALELLLAAGGDVNHRLPLEGEGRGNTLCTAAVTHGHADILHILVQNGADCSMGRAGFSSATDRTTLVWTPCAIAADVGSAECLEVLIKEGKVDVNQGDEHNWTPVMHAARKGNMKCLEVLINEGSAHANPGEGAPLVCSRLHATSYVCRSRQHELFTLPTLAAGTGGQLPQRHGLYAFMGRLRFRPTRRNPCPHLQGKGGSQPSYLSWVHPTHGECLVWLQRLCGSPGQGGRSGGEQCDSRVQSCLRGKEAGNCRHIQRAT